MSVAAKITEESPRQAICRVLQGTGLTADIAAGYAELICQHYSGETVYFALREWKALAERDDRIRAERKSGRSLGWLANQHCISRTQVRRICGELSCGED